MDKHDCKSDSYSIVERYIDLSNKGDLDAIASLIDVDATYNSDVVGIFYGKENIMQMKKTFFASIQDQHWHVIKFEPLSDNIFRFTFDFHCIDAVSNASVSRQGIETVVLNQRGLIQHVDVKKLS